MSRGIEPRALTPRRVVEELDRHVVGQARAKRAVAIALRNRWRRGQVEGPLRDEISPKNIIMVGPTGVGKTELARRLARLSGAPFLKVEVSKFTEVGYVGRDVDSIMRDLIEVAHDLVRVELEREVMGDARREAEERVLDLLLPPVQATGSAGAPATGAGTAANQASREKLRELLRAGKLDDREVEVEIEEEQGPPMGQGMPGSPLGEQLGSQIREALGALGRKRVRRRVLVSEATRLLATSEAGRLIDREKLRRTSVERTEELGVVFLDEIDKICSREGSRTGEVSREGVQRDLLPLVEGTTVATRYGPVRSDHVLFIAAGAFHMAKVSDLIPELQGRFPIRVELDSLGPPEFVRILRDTEHCLLKQAAALLETEGLSLVFDDEAVAELAEVASKANAALENIGARRLHTVLERVLDELSFEASELGQCEIRITAAYVRERIGDLLQNEDLSRHIL